MWGFGFRVQSLGFWGVYPDFTVSSFGLWVSGNFDIRGVSGSTGAARRFVSRVLNFGFRVASRDSSFEFLSGTGAARREPAPAKSSPAARNYPGFRNCFISGYGISVFG